MHRVVYALIAVFSISSWIDLVGVFGELPLMVPHLPEGWSISVYFKLCTQIPVIAPIIVYIWIVVRPGGVPIRLLSGGTMFIATLALGSLIFCWKRSVKIGQKRYSVPLYVVVLILGLVDKTSTVLFYRYLERFPKVYLAAVLIGESLTGVIPAVMKLTQGGSDPYCVRPNYTLSSNNTDNDVIQVFSEPRYSVSIYFSILTAVMCLCVAAFVALEIVPSLKAVQITPPIVDADKSKKRTSKKTLKSLFSRSCGAPITDDQEKVNLRTNNIVAEKQWVDWEYINHLVILFIVSFALWGCTNSLYTYSMLPYGFTTTNNALIIVNAIRFTSVLVAMRVPMTSQWKINVVGLVTMVLTGYMMMTAVYSPCPPLVDTKTGSVLAIVTSAIIDYVTSYVKCCIVKIAQSKHNNAVTTTALVTTVGVVMGTVVSTIMLQQNGWFLTRDFCRNLTTQCTGFRSLFLPRQ